MCVRERICLCVCMQCVSCVSVEDCVCVWTDTHCACIEGVGCV